jgi:hypothetical protein
MSEEEPEPQTHGIAESDLAEQPEPPARPAWLDKLWAAARVRDARADSEEKFGSLALRRLARDGVSLDLWELEKLLMRRLEQGDASWEAAEQWVSMVWAQFSFNPAPDCVPHIVHGDTQQDATRCQLNAFLKAYPARWELAYGLAKSWKEEGKFARPDEWFEAWRNYWNL